MDRPSSVPPRYWNATLIFETVTTELVIDSETGNMLPKSSKVETKAIVKQSSKGLARSQPGQNVSEIPVVGYMAQPVKMPVQPPVEVSAIVDGKRGRLRIPALIRTPYETELQEKHSGQKFEGFFTVQG